MSRLAILAEPRRNLVSWHTGAGADTALIERRVVELNLEYQDSRVFFYRLGNLRCLFQALAQRWREDTRFESSVDKITSHPSYQAIVRMGDEIVPFLLEELRKEPQLWFTALRQITGVDPVPPDKRGDTRAMAVAWVRWGQNHSIIK